MANLFSGVEPPRWLQEAARPIDAAAFGKALGETISGVVQAFDRDPNAPDDTSWWNSRVGLRQGLSDAHMDNLDPLWRYKAERLEQGALDLTARIQNEHAKTVAQNNETKALIDDTPALSKYITDASENPTWMGPPPKSKYAMAMVEKKQQAIAANSLRRQAVANSSTEAKIAVQTHSNLLKRTEALAAYGDAGHDAIVDLGLIKDPKEALQKLRLYEAQFAQREKDEAAQSDLPVTGITTTPGKPNVTRRSAEKKTSTQLAQDYYDSLVNDKNADPEAIAMAKAALDRTAKGTKAAQSDLPTIYDMAPNGQWVAKTPGYAPRYLRDPKQDMAAKVAYSEYHFAETALNKARSDGVKDEKLLPFKEAVLSAKQKIDKLFTTPAPTKPAAAQPANGAPAVIKTQDAYDALPRGATYTGEDGKAYRKP